jgi:hypothetical protein
MHRFLPTLVIVALASSPAAGQGGAAQGTAEAGAANAGTAAPLRTSAPPILPGTGADAFIHIQGNALDARDAPLPENAVRLRDARYGRVVTTAITDKAGLFEFRTVDPGSYVVELLGADQVVLAASELLHVNAGESVSVVVKLPLRLPQVGGFLGHTVQQAAAVVAAAAASGVLASSVVGVDATPQVR